MTRTRKLSISSCATVFTAGLFAAPAIAGNGNIQMIGEVSPSCTILVTQNGLLAQAAGARRLASSVRGGRVGRAQVTTTGNGHTLAIEAPTSFEEEPSDDAASLETFTAGMRSGRATAFGWTAGQQNLNLGRSDITVRMEARKVPNTSFANGDYRATVTLRCE